MGHCCVLRRFLLDLAGKEGSRHSFFAISKKMIRCPQLLKIIGVCVGWVPGIWRSYAADRVVWDMTADR